MGKKSRKKAESKSTRLQPVEQPRHAELKPLFNSLLDKLDANSDGVLSKSEIGHGVDNRLLSIKEHHLVAFLKLCYPVLKKIASLQERRDTPLLRKVRRMLKGEGYDRQSIEQIRGALAEAGRETDIFDEILEQGLTPQLFFVLGLPDIQQHGGRLSKADIKQAVRKFDTQKRRNEPDGYPDSVKLVLRYMLTAFERIDSGDGAISVKELWQHVFSTRFETLRLAKAADAILRDLPNRTVAVNRGLYRDARTPLNSIKPEAIRQGFIGDCGFLAMLSSLASLHPESIVSAISDNGDGTFSVVFPAQPNEPIAVHTPTESELLLYAGGTELGIWPAIMEKACGEYCSRSPLRRTRCGLDWSVQNLIGSKIPNENAALGGWDLFGPITCHSLSKYTEDRLETMVVAAVAERRPVIFWRNMLDVITNRRRRQAFWRDGNNSIWTAHAYGLVSYNKNARSLRVYNPWGCNNPQFRLKPADDDGLVELTLDRFLDTFTRCLEVMPV